MDRDATLTALELVLGIDNIIFISILVGKLEPVQREGAAHRPLPRHVHAHRIADGAVVDRGPHAPMFTVLYTDISAGSHPHRWRRVPGVKSTRGIHQLTEGEEGHASKA
jgi:hypothetical protein